MKTKSKNKKKLKFCEFNDIIASLIISNILCLYGIEEYIVNNIVLLLLLYY